MTDYFYLTEIDLFRLGNSTSPRLDHVRVPKDIPTFFRGPIEFVGPGIVGCLSSGSKACFFSLQPVLFTLEGSRGG